MKYLFILFALVTFSFSHAQDSLQFQPSFVLNKKLTIDVNKYKHKLKGGELTESTIQYRCHVKILTKTDSSFTGEWCFKTMKSSDNESFVVQYMNKMLEGLRYRFMLKSNGEFKSLEDWGQVKRQLERNLDKLAGANLDAKVKEQILNIKQFLSNEEAVKLAVTKDLQLYLSCYGVKVPLKDSVMVRSEIPNVMGGMPIPAYLTYRLDQKSNQKHLYTNLILNHTLGQEIVEDMMRKYYQAKKIDASGNNMYKFDFNDTKEHVIENNYIRSVKFKRSIQYGDLLQTETETLVCER